MLAKQIRNTYPFLYVTKGITREDILAFIDIRIYMGIHKLLSVTYYWSNEAMHKDYIKKIMPKNYFFLLAKTLHFPEKENEDKKEKEKDRELCSEEEISKIV